MCWNVEINFELKWNQKKSSRVLVWILPLIFILTGPRFLRDVGPSPSLEVRDDEGCEEEAPRG